MGWAMTVVGLMCMNTHVLVRSIHTRLDSISEYFYYRTVVVCQKETLTSSRLFTTGKGPWRPPSSVAVLVLFRHQLQVDVPGEESPVRVVLQQVGDPLQRGVEGGDVGGDDGKISHLKRGKGSR